MEVVEGRKEDFITTEKDKLVHGACFCYSLKNDLFMNLKFINLVDNLHVQTVKTSRFNSDSEKMREDNLRNALGKHEHFQVVRK